MTEQELNQVREELAAISEMIGPGSAYENLLPPHLEAVPLNFEVRDILSLIPPQHRLDAGIKARSQVTLPIAELFKQVETGAVRVTLGFLAQHLPLQSIGYIPPKEVDMSISIPLIWIHEAIWHSHNNSDIEGIPLSRWLN